MSDTPQRNRDHINLEAGSGISNSQEEDDRMNEKLGHSLVEATNSPATQPLQE